MNNEEYRATGFPKVKRGAPLTERFWTKVHKTDTCWLWISCTRPGGYGMVWLNAKRRGVVAHRVAWELTYGPIPDGMLVCHKCDVPACVRPDHLFLGTVAENNQDRMHKQRSATGAHSPHAKLTPDQVRTIRQRYKQGPVCYSDLAREYHVGHHAIRDVIIGHTWQHLED